MMCDITHHRYTLFDSKVQDDYLLQQKLTLFFYFLSSIPSPHSHPFSFPALPFTSLLFPSFLFTSLCSDEVGVQNAFVHFWNLHLHIFRKGISGSAMIEVQCCKRCTVCSIVLNILQREVVLNTI